MICCHEEHNFCEVVMWQMQWISFLQLWLFCGGGMRDLVVMLGWRHNDVVLFGVPYGVIVLVHM
jgi:hypothetical protein